MIGLRRPSSFAALAGAFILAGCSSAKQHEQVEGPACAANPSGMQLGCANLANLAAMVADPADLNRGRVLTPASGARQARVIEDYENPPPDPSHVAGPDRTRVTGQ